MEGAGGEADKAEGEQQKRAKEARKKWRKNGYKRSEGKRVCHPVKHCNDGRTRGGRKKTSLKKTQFRPLGQSGVPVFSVGLVQCFK